MSSENPGAVVSGALPRLEPLRSVRTDALEGVTKSPTDSWVAQQLREATPLMDKPRGI
jgi:hypothetical protein